MIHFVSELSLDERTLLSEKEDAVLFHRAQDHFNQDQYDCARADLTLLLERDPDHINALIISAAIYYKTNQVVELLHDLNHLLSLQSFVSDPEMLEHQIRIRACRSDVYINQKEYTLALPDLAYLIEQTYEHRAHNHYYTFVNARSEIFKAQGKLEEELSDLKALLTPPFFYSQKHLLHAAYGNVHPYSRRGLYRRSEIYVDQENYDDALESLDALLHENAFDAPALMLRRHVYHILNKKEQALSDEADAHDAMLVSPVYKKQSEARFLMLDDDDLDGVDFEQDKIERVIPSLQAFCRMTFFQHEAHMDTSDLMVQHAASLHSRLRLEGITPQTIDAMRIKLHAKAYPGSKTVFEELATHELTLHDEDVGALRSENKKRKHDEMSLS